ncbi:MAG TPA: hypothetical protein VK587_14830 [bacterium]|jgi:hypothetical protein|nr:hypothetical protein [bacterium]
MSREQILALLLSNGAISLIRTIEDVESGRVRRVRIDPIPGSPAFTREVMQYLYSLGAHVEITHPVQRSHVRSA